MARHYTCLQARGLINTFFNAQHKDDSIKAMLLAMKHIGRTEGEDDCKSCIRYFNVEKKKRLGQIESKKPLPSTKVTPIKKRK